MYFDGSNKQSWAQVWSLLIYTLHSNFQPPVTWTPFQMSYRWEHSTGYNNEIHVLNQLSCHFYAEKTVTCVKMKSQPLPCLNRFAFWMWWAGGCLFSFTYSVKYPPKSFHSKITVVASSIHFISFVSYNLFVLSNCCCKQSVQTADPTGISGL